MTSQCCQRVHYRYRITLQFVLLACILGFIPLVAPLGMYWALGMVLALGVSTSFLQSSAYGFAVIFPPIYAANFYTAQAYAGLVTALLRIITKLALPGDNKASIAIYFSISGVVQIACAIVFTLVSGMDVTKALVNESLQAKAGFGRLGRDQGLPGLCSKPGDIDLAEEASALVPSDSYFAEEAEAEAAETAARSSGTRRIHRGRPVSGASDLAPRTPAAARAGTGVGAQRHRKPDEGLVADCVSCCGICMQACVADETADVRAKVPTAEARRTRLSMFGWVCGRGGLDTFNILAVFVITFLSFPNITDRIAYRGTMGSLFAGPEWWGIFLLLLFNIGDCSGRFTAERIGNCCGRWYTVVTLLRGVTVVVFYFCMDGALGDSSDWISTIVMLAMAFTNGWCSAVAFGAAPTRVSPDFGPQIGSLTATGVVYGIAIGSVISTLAFSA